MGDGVQGARPALAPVRSRLAIRHKPSTPNNLDSNLAGLCL